MTFDYSKLRGKIIERYNTMGRFADAADIERSWLSATLTHGKSIRQDTIIKIADVLELRGQIEDYFFTEAVHKIATNADKKETTDAT